MAWRWAFLDTYRGVEIKTGGNRTVRDPETRDGKQAGVLIRDHEQGAFTRGMHPVRGSFDPSPGE
jgi:hypothetical protein